MSAEPRNDLIRRLEAKRGSRVIAYVNGDRAPFGTQIAEDAVWVFRRHLAAIGRTRQLDLVLYSRGGDLLTPLRLVRLIREHCERFNVVIPFRAHSAATLIALGADEIVMGSTAELTPVDATTQHPFNPSDPTSPQQRLPISVEDVSSFLSLASDRAYLSKRQMIEAFRMMTSQVSALALGNAYRTSRSNRLIVRKLLECHLDPAKDRSRIDRLEKSLTEGLFLHGYPICRGEAREAGLPVVNADADTETLLWDLLQTTPELFDSQAPFDPSSLVSAEGGRYIFRRWVPTSRASL